MKESHEVQRQRELKGWTPRARVEVETLGLGAVGEMVRKSCFPPSCIRHGRGHLGTRHHFISLSFLLKQTSESQAKEAFLFFSPQQPLSRVAPPSHCQSKGGILPGAP